MRFIDAQNEEALDILADIIEPVSVVFNDAEIVKAFRGGQNLKAVKIILKSYKTQVVEILARLEGVEPKDYKANIIKMTKSLLELVNNPDVLDFFSSFQQNEQVVSSGNVTEITQGKDK